jgi:phage-related minor tail protein
MNINIKVSINSGAALIIFIAAFFLLLLGVAFFPPVAANFVAAGALLVGAFGGYLKKRDSNNQIALKAEIAGLAADPGAGMLNG